jgi:cation:H+ antiporter
MTTTALSPVTATLSRPLFRSLVIVGVIICPALVVRFAGIHPTPILGLITYGAAVVAASFLLAWAAEVAQIDVSGGLAVAVLGSSPYFPSTRSTCITPTPQAMCPSTPSTPRRT